MVKSKLTVFILLTALSLNLFAEGRPIEFIFDIDDTLISADIRKLPAEEIEQMKKSGFAIEPIIGHVYRINHGAAEVLASLQTVGFFSAHGNDERSRKIVAHFGAKYSSSTLLTTTHIFQLGDSADRSALALQPPFDLFEGDKKKDLSQSSNFKDHDVILIDNDPSHALRGQEKNFIWVRNKTVKFELARVRGLIDLAQEYASKKRLRLPEALWQLQWIVTSDGQLIYRQDICEHPDVYQRGLRILRDVNPLFDMNAFHLDGLESRRNVSISDGVVFNSNSNWEQRVVPQKGWRSKLSSLMAVLFGASIDSKKEVLPESLELLNSLPIVGSSYTDSKGAIHQVVMADYEDGELPKFVIRNKIDGSLAYLFVAENDSQESIKRISSTADFFETLAAHHFLGPKVHERRQNYFLTQIFQMKHSAARWLTKIDKAQAHKDRKMIALNAFLMDSAAKGIYFSALAPEDLVWNGGQWMLIHKSGTFRQDLTSKDILDRYRDRFRKRWGIAVLSGECDSIL